MGRPAKEEEKFQFSVYCERDLVDRLERFGKKFGMSRNEAAVFFIETGLKPAEKMDKAGVLRLLDLMFSHKKEVMAAKVLSELA